MTTDTGVGNEPTEIVARHGLNHRHEIQKFTQNKTEWNVDMFA